MTAPLAHGRPRARGERNNVLVAGHPVLGEHPALGLAEQRLHECRRGLPIKTAYRDALESDWIRKTMQLLLTESPKANQPQDTAIGRPAKDGAPEWPDRLVQPLRVVNHDDEGRFIGERGDELDERIEEHRGMVNSVRRGFIICELAQCRVGPRLAPDGPRLAD